MRVVCLAIALLCAAVVLAQVPDNDAIWQYSSNYYERDNDVPTPEQLATNVVGPVHPSVWGSVVGTSMPILALFHDESSRNSRNTLKRLRALVSSSTSPLDDPEANVVGLAYLDSQEWSDWAHGENYLLADETWALLYFPPNSVQAQPVEDITPDGLSAFFEQANAEVENEYGPRIPSMVWQRLNAYLESAQTHQAYSLISEYPHLSRSSNEDGLTLLHLAAHYDLPKFMKKALTVYNCTTWDRKDRFSRTPLHIAAQKASTRNVKHLIRAGADLNALNFESETPSYVALQSWMSHQKRAHGGPKSKHNKAIKLLLDAGAEPDPESRDNARFFHLAIRARNIPLVEMLLETGKIDISARSRRSNNWNALHFACDESEFQVIVSKHILTKGTKLPHHMSAGHDSLAGWGFDITPDVLTGYDRMYNRSQFDASMSRGFQAMVKLLLDYTDAKGNKVDVNARDDFDATPLHLIAYHGDFGVGQLLIDAGAEVSPKDRHGSTPLRLAATRNYLPMQRFLLEQGAKRSEIADLKFYGEWPSDPPAEGDELRYHQPISEAKREPYERVVNPRTADGGGWNTKEKSEVDINWCDLDRRSNLTVQEFIDEYLLPGKPVIITDCCSHWPAFDLWRKDSFREKFSDAQFKIMTDRNGRPHSLDQTASQYLKWLDKHSGEKYPRYLFDGAFEDPYPDILADVGRIEGSSQSNLKLQRDYFNMYEYFTYQLVVGPPYAGANPHFHHTTWNVLLFGRKRWMIWPPAQSFYSSKHPHHWFTDDYEKHREGNQPLECIQESGDLFFIPDMWGHAVVNINDAVAIAESTFFGHDSYSGVSAPV